MHLGYNQNFQVSTPSPEISEGLNPARLFLPAPYLPLMHYDVKLTNYKVMLHGRLTTVDQNNYIVPAGLIRDIEKAYELDTAAWAAENLDEYGSVYSQIDIEKGIKNAKGQTPALGEPVVKSFFSNSGDGISSQTLFIGAVPIGVASYDVYQYNGPYGQGNVATNPADFNYTNFNPQAGVSVLTRRFLKYPVVTGVDDLAIKALPCFIGTPKPGDLVTFDNTSNLITLPVIAADPTNAQLRAQYSYAMQTIGRVLFIRSDWPEGALQFVKTYNPNTGNEDLSRKAPGSATNGLPDNLTQAGVTDPDDAKMVEILFSI